MNSSILEFEKLILSLYFAEKRYPQQELGVWSMSDLGKENNKLLIFNI